VITDVISWLSRLAGKTAEFAVPTGMAVVDRLQVVDGWLVGPGVLKIEMHASWRYSWLSTPLHDPLAIVAHYTDTAPGTAISMAKRRQQPWSEFAAAFRKNYPGKPVPQNSWHGSIETDGLIVQMAPFTTGCWHVGSPTAVQIPGVGWGNRTAVGIELVNNDRGKTFPPAQVASARNMWRAIVRAYGIPQAHAMISHQSIDPLRRSDPGGHFMKDIAPSIIDFAYA
jgi:hypothetical protein